jgi:hypothetical protein
MIEPSRPHAHGRYLEPTSGCSPPPASRPHAHGRYSGSNIMLPPDDVSVRTPTGATQSACCCFRFAP